MTARTAPLLEMLRTAFDETCTALAIACSNGVSLDAAALDREQGAEFELAWAKAELEAATALLVHAPSLTALQRQVADVFVADTVPRVIARLQAIDLDLNRDNAALRSLSHAPALRAFRRDAGSSHALAGVGRAVIDAPAASASVTS